MATVARKTSQLASTSSSSSQESRTLIIMPLKDEVMTVTQNHDNADFTSATRNCAFTADSSSALDSTPALLKSSAMRGMEAPSFGASKNWSRGRHLEELSKDSNSLAVLLREAANGSATAVAIIKNSETRQKSGAGAAATSFTTVGWDHFYDDGIRNQTP